MRQDLRVAMPLWGVEFPTTADEINRTAIKAIDIYRRQRQDFDQSYAVYPMPKESTSINMVPEWVASVRGFVDLLYLFSIERQPEATVVYIRSCMNVSEVKSTEYVLGIKE